MATNTSKVFIDIITQFTGTKSIKQAETSFDKLAKSIGRVVSVAAIEEFSRASIKAFLADDAAANQLIKTLDNLGIAFNPGSLDAYIQNLQNTTGVLDDQLRPAFSQLAVATKDYATAQSLLTTALDVSQATGKSLSAVTTALSKAYLGNYAAVSRLGAGISKAQIKAGNFNDIQKTLNQNFGGAALAAADTYAGKLKIVGAAFTDVKEIIGKGLVDAFTNLVGENGSATKFANSLRDSAQYIADIIRGLGIVAAKLKPIESFFQKFTGAGAIQSIPVLGSWLTILNDLGKTKRVSGVANDTYSRQKQLLVSQTRSLAVSKELVKATTAQTKATKDKLAAEKASLVLKTAAKVLDVDQAQILIALTRDISKADQDRLLLQQALLNDNADAAGKLAEKVIQAQLQAIALGALNPLSGWTGDIAAVIASLVDLQAELLKVTGATLTGKQLLTTDFAQVVADSTDTSFLKSQEETDAALQLLKDALAASKDVGDKLAGLLGGNNSDTAISPSYIDNFMLRNATTGAYNNSTQTINLVVDGQVLTSVVTNGQQDTSASGISPAVSRINPYSSGF